MPAAGIPQLYTYNYDQLNRLTAQRTYKGLNSVLNKWVPVSIKDYNENISYDANGNILTYNRYGNAAIMDSMTYNYEANRNRLSSITDKVSSSAYTVDIDNQPVANYAYDSIGNMIKDSSGGIQGVQWTVYGKIQQITKYDGSTIAYTYDAGGNRISKAVTSGSTTVTTWYVRDASGNVMGVYTKGDNSVNSGQLSQTEVDLYGSSRLGMWKPNINVQTWVQPTPLAVTGMPTGYFLNFTRGQKYYELSNHLGNVLATISDRKTIVSSGGTVSYYTADVMSAQDYYPFGMLQPGRNTSTANYRYGFNSKENDNEVKGTGNQQDYGMRIYDPRLGRFLSTDPLTAKFPFYTPYQFAGNTPIQATDLDGAEELKATTPGGKKTALLVMGTSEFTFNAIQSSTNTNFDQVYTFTQIKPNTLTNESQNNSYKSLVGRVRGAYGEGVAEYLTISAMQETFIIKGELLGDMTIKTKKTQISEDNSNLKPGEASFALQKAGFDFVLEFRCGPKGEGIFSERVTLFNIFQNADGTPDLELYSKDEKKVFGIEIKTYNPTNASINIKGFNEAADLIIKAYKQNNGKVDGGKLIPVLQTDEKAWNDAYQKNPSRMQNIYDKINSVGGKLQLISNLFKGSNDNMQQTKRLVNANQD